MTSFDLNDLIDTLETKKKWGKKRFSECATFPFRGSLYRISIGGVSTNKTYVIEYAIV